MNRFVVGVAAFALSAPAVAGSYRVVLEPVNGKMLVGHAGVQAVDEFTDGAQVRLISPGNEVKDRGTVRVLVRNLGKTPFRFGPDDVKLELADGTALTAASLDKYEKSAEMVQREMGHARAIDIQVKNSLSSYAQQSGGSHAGDVVQGGPGAPTGPAANFQDHSRVSDDNELPGAWVQNALYQLLLPETVGPNQVWGGYYVFDMPKPAFERRADQQLTILVRTGGEEHRFKATLHWK